MSLAARLSASRTSLHLAILAGAILPLAAAPFDLPAITFVFAPLLALSLEAGVRGGDSALGGVFPGFVAGFFVHVVAFAWFGPMIVVHGHLPYWVAALASVLMFAAQALPYAYAALLTRVAMGAGVRATVALPPAIALAFALVPMMFPFRPSTPVVELLPFVQMADLGGETLVDLVTAAVGCAALEALRTRRVWVALLALTLFGVPCAYGLSRIDAIEAARARATEIRVGIVQPNIAIEVKHDVRKRRQQMYALRTLTQRAEREGAELVAWPESAYPYRIARAQPRDVIGDRSIRRDGLVRGPLIFGVITGTGICDQFNSAVGMARDGTFSRPVDKARLLPFVETFPGWQQSAFLTRMRPCFGFGAAPRAAVLELEGFRVGMMNCYEDLIAEHGRELAQARPHFLLNLTNDGWFLDSQEPHLHHMAARYRAIEIRRDLVRDVNTGVSGLVSATGERLAQTATYTEAALVVPVRVLSTTTFFAAHGDFVRDVAIALLLATVIVARLRARARSAPQAE